MCASPFTFAEALRHHPGGHGFDSGGWRPQVGIGREIDEIMQEEETEKLGQAGRTGERIRFDWAVSHVSLASVSQCMYRE